MNSVNVFNVLNIEFDQRSENDKIDSSVIQQDPEQLLWVNETQENEEIYDDDENENEWSVVTSKGKDKFMKREQLKEKQEKRRKDRDMRYLLTHTGFQRYRLRRDEILDIILDYKAIGVEFTELYIIGHGRCRGHLINYDATVRIQRCLECFWNDSNVKAFHCCCSQETKSSLPQNFYLGFNGLLNEYLRYMKEPPITLDS